MIEKEVVRGPLLFFVSRRNFISKFFVFKKCRQGTLCRIAAPQRALQLLPAPQRLPPQVLERAKGIEPSYAAWEAAVLPLNYAR
jgi:hypothetical protein